MDDKTKTLITTGAIFELMLIKKHTIERFLETVNSINADCDLSPQGKEKKIASVRQTYSQKLAELKTDMLNNLEKVKNLALNMDFEYSTELEHSIDFLKTMAESKILTPGMIAREVNKFKGDEMALVFMREKVKDSIPVDAFNKYTFSTYSDYDANGNRNFVPPTEFFKKLEEYINTDNDDMTSVMMKELETKLGVSSVGRKNFEEEQRADLQVLSDSIPKVI